MKKRHLSLLLCLVMVLSLFPAFGMSAAAAGEPDANGIWNPDPAQGADDQLNLTKTLAPGENGTYDLTLESWATGEVTTDSITEKVPTDFVIVVDQSGSMKEEDMATGGYAPVSNQYLETIANSSTPYYYKDGDQYYRVYAKRGYLYQYHAKNTFSAIDVVRNSSMSFNWFDNSQENDSANPKGQIYIKDDSGKMRLLYISVTKPAGFVSVHFAMNLNYRDDASNPVPLLRPSNNGDIQTNTSWFDFNNNTIGVKTWGGREDYNFQWAFGRSVMINYDLYVRHSGYTELCYQDVEGEEHVINSTGNVGTAQYCDANQNALTSETGQRMQYSGLYTASGMESRLAALNSALNSFASAVANEEDDFGPVNNKVSIIGFSSPGYSNTELLTHTERNVSGNNGWQKNTCDSNVSEYYGKGLVPIIAGDSVGSVNQKVTAAIGAITANGGTQPEDGLEMAYKVLKNRSVTDYTIRGGDNAGDTVPRNQVVIFFTDGRPGNNDSYDQYAEASEVVAMAKNIKQELGATIFSIGVFGESDGNPLTYPVAKSSGTVYDLGYVSDCESDDDYYLYRQWRANDAANYGAKPNDTIFSYMSVVSSNYPDAELFITDEWLNGNHSGTYIHATDGIRHKETAETTNKYYRMASNQQSLIAAFLQAATMNSETIHSDTAVPLDATAVFKDDVKLSDFDITGATYTVKWQPVRMVGDELQNNGAAQTKVDAQPVPANGKIEYTGFDYSGNYVTTANPGQKLVVIINGLTPKRIGDTLLSNEGNAGVYGKDEDKPTVQIESPTLVIPGGVEETCVIDYNYPVQLTTSLASDKVLINGGTFTTNGKSGTYTKSGTILTYQLGTEKLNPTTGERSDSTSLTKKYDVTLKSYEGADKALFFENGNVWKEVTTVPANNVYYDDAILNTPVAASTIEGTGYNAGMTSSSADEFGGKMVYYTFKGTGIDVYSTTTDKSKLVTAEILDASGNVVTNLKGEKCSMAMRNYSESTRLNVPSVFFRDLEYGTYILTVYASANAKYNIDGIRVYNPAGTDKEANDLYAADDLREQNATFENFRKMLIANGTDLIDENGVRDAEGVGFYLDRDHSGTAQLADYTVDGPKNEIYLAKDTGIAFKITNWKDLQDECGTGIKLMVGLSTPDEGKAGSSVKLSNMVEDEATYTPVTVNSPVDMYYEVKPNTDGIVVIFNAGDNMVSLTNLKISGGTSPITASFAPTDAAPLAVTEEEAAVTMNLVVDQSTMDFASRFATLRTTAEVTAEQEHEAQSLADMIRQLISNFVQQLFSNIAKLFGK